MTESGTVLNALTKLDKYKALIPQIKELVSGGSSLFINLLNICSALKYTMDGFFWAGFYLREGDELVLGPFQGPVACARIKIPNGVCGTAVKEKRTIIVDDVDSFPGHIACSPESKSEIVVPVFSGNDVTAVLDVDSASYSRFDETDREFLEQVCSLVSELMEK